MLTELTAALFRQGVQNLQDLERSNSRLSKAIASRRELRQRLLNRVCPDDRLTPKVPMPPVLAVLDSTMSTDGCPWSSRGNSICVAVLMSRNVVETFDFQQQWWLAKCIRKLSCLRDQRATVENLCWQYDPRHTHPP